MKRILFLILFLLSSNPAYAITNWVSEDDCISAWLMNKDESPLTDSNTENTNWPLALAAAGEPDFASADPPDSSDGFDGTSTGYYVFDGVDDWLETSTYQRPNTWDGVTLVTWVYWTSSDRDYNVIQSNQKAGDPYWRMGIEPDDDKLRFAINPNGSDIGHLAGVVTQDEWHHAAGTYNATTGDIKIYNNGVVDDGYTPGATGWDSSGQVYPTVLGHNAQKDNNEYEGRQTQVGLFSTVHDSTDINDMMDNGLYQVAAAGRTRRFF